MAEQLDMFAAPAAAPTCPRHGPQNVCELCPERYATDHTGFVHRSDCAGRIPLRTCHICKQLRSPGNWNHADWHSCLSCVPLGQLSERGRSSYVPRKK